MFLKLESQIPYNLAYMYTNIRVSRTSESTLEVPGIYYNTIL